jgi:hypothetical protein
MRDFNKVSPALWQSSRFADLPSDDGRYLYLYLLTCPHQNSAGCCWLPDGYACNDLRWEPERYRTARQSLADAGLIQFDAESGFVLIERWFKHNPPMNQSHHKGIINQLEKCGSPELQKRCEAQLEAVWQQRTIGKATEKPSAPRLPSLTPGHRLNGAARP